MALDTISSSAIYIIYCIFNTNISHLDEGIKCFLSRSADDIKLGGNADLLKCRKAQQKDLDRLDRWAEDSGMRFNTAKHWVLALGSKQPHETEQE